MASTIDYQKIHDRYQTEGVPRQISIVKFCEQNGAPYKQYENWYKRCRGGRPVQVTLVDTEASDTSNLVQVYHKMHMDSSEFYENYFKQPGTFKNRFAWMIKRSIGTKDAFDKMCYLVRTFDFVNLDEAEAKVDWSKVKLVEL